MSETITNEIRTEPRTKLAYRKQEAAELMGLSRWTLWREIKRRKIFPTRTTGVITHEECLRYLREEVQVSKRTKRFPRVHNN